MMATQSMTSPKSGSSAGSGNCGCGCGGTALDCCQLDCLVQPRFFCGQLLTDQDLGALVDWAKDKARLARFRHGWGVICGLDVRCGCTTPGQIKVEPGYALSCCGDDIVVCSETTFSLANVCSDAPDPCAALRPAAETNDEPEVDLCGFSVPGNQVRAADLYISYQEVGSDPQAAMPRSACTAVSPCEFTRTKESFVLSYQVAIRGADPQRAAAEEWLKNFSKCSQVVEEFVSQGLEHADRSDVQHWLLHWVDSNPLCQFCFLKYHICGKDGLKTEADIAKVLFWMVQDCRNSFLACSCYRCQQSRGVPLARIWLQSTKDSNGKPQCCVLGIDSDPPHRRMIESECWPAPFGSVNMAPVIWRRAEEAPSVLRGLGISVTERVKFTIPKSVTELNEVLKRGTLFASRGETRKLHVLEAGSLGARVVAVSE